MFCLDVSAWNILPIDYPSCGIIGYRTALKCERYSQFILYEYMKSWYEALKILLEEIDLTVAELSHLTGSSPSNINKFMQGKSNGSVATLQRWLRACELHFPGSQEMFYLICMEKVKKQQLPELELKPKKFTVQDHVDGMTPQELAKYLRAIGNRLNKGEDLAESCHQSEDRSSSETESLKS